MPNLSKEQIVMFIILGAALAVVLLTPLGVIRF